MEDPTKLDPYARPIDLESWRRTHVHWFQRNDPTVRCPQVESGHGSRLAQPKHHVRARVCLARRQAEAPRGRRGCPALRQDPSATCAFGQEPKRHVGPGGVPKRHVGAGGVPKLRQQLKRNVSPHSFSTIVITVFFKIY
jgi:hypothetical protein